MKMYQHMFSCDLELVALISSYVYCVCKYIFRRCAVVCKARYSDKLRAFCVVAMSAMWTNRVGDL